MGVGAVMVSAQERREALARARELVIAGAELREAAAACGLSVDVCKRASAREGWITQRKQAPEPAVLLRHASAETLSAKAAGLLEEALTDGRKLRPQDLVVLERWAREREQETREILDFSHVPPALLDDLNRALLAIEGIDASNARHPDYEYPYKDANASAADRVADLERDLSAVRLERDQAVSAQLAAEQERDEARATLSRIDGTAALARWDLPGAED